MAGNPLIVWMRLRSGWFGQRLRSLLFESRQSASSMLREFRFAEPKLAGIGGWLILVVIGQVGGIFRLLGDIADYYGGVDAKLFQQFPMTFYGEAALNLALFGFVVYVTFLFFGNRENFRAILSTSIWP